MSQQKEVATESKQEELFNKIMSGEIELLLCIDDFQFDLLTLLLSPCV